MPKVNKSVLIITNGLLLAISLALAIYYTQQLSLSQPELSYQSLQQPRVKQPLLSDEVKPVAAFIPEPTATNTPIANCDSHHTYTPTLG